MLWFGLATDENDWKQQHSGSEYLVYAEFVKKKIGFISSSKYAIKDFKLPAGWDWDTNWDKHGESMPDFLSDVDSGCDEFIHTVFEIQEKVNDEWNTSYFTDSKFKKLKDKENKPVKDIKDIKAPAGWKWEGDEWGIDLNRSCDEEGIINLNINKRKL